MTTGLQYYYISGAPQEYFQAASVAQPTTNNCVNYPGWGPGWYNPTIRYNSRCGGSSCLLK